MVDLKANPFYLSDEDIKWVQDTLAKMSTEKKVGQLFCPVGTRMDEAAVKHIVKDVGVCGIMSRPGSKELVLENHRLWQANADIPLLIAANTEGGGNGLLTEGTSFGCPMAVAATGDPESAYRMGYTACAEGAAVGLNWSFAPIIDIDSMWRNPITNTRTFGSDPEMVAACGEAYLRGADEAGVAVSIKHFPGDGQDERDQHLATTINSMSADRWRATYGMVYKRLIDKGAKTVMVGHIAQPAMVEAVDPNASVRQKLMPASLSYELVTGVLRNEMGFNGLISTDATPMIGFTTALPRRQAVPAAIAAGCDVFLFNKNFDEDYKFMLQGVRDGVITQERLDDAVTRILALKASLGLHKKTLDQLVPPSDDIIGCQQFKDWARKVADEAITLVKDTQNLLPVSPEKYPRVYLNDIENTTRDPMSPVAQRWKAAFEKAGFQVQLRDRQVTFGADDFSATQLPPEKLELLREMDESVDEFRENFDLYVYVVNIQNASNNTVLRINWNVTFGKGNDGPWFTPEVPALFISSANPYHLFDAPMMRTFINAYSTSQAFVDATMDKITGKSPFKGKSPVDPFCGNEYIKMAAEAGL